MWLLLSWYDDDHLPIPSDKPQLICEILITEDGLILTPDLLDQISASTFNHVLSAWQISGRRLIARAHETNQLTHLRVDQPVRCHFGSGLVLLDERGCHDDLLDHVIEERRSNKHLRFERQPKTGSIYLLKSENGYWKIGRSINPLTRLEQLSKDLPIQISLIHSFPADDAVEAERNIHKLFESKRLGQGEWFRLLAEDVETIRSITEWRNGMMFFE